MASNYPDGLSEGTPWAPWNARDDDRERCAGCGIVVDGDGLAEDGELWQDELCASCADAVALAHDMTPARPYQWDRLLGGGAGAESCPVCEADESGRRACSPRHEAAWAAIDDAERSYYEAEFRSGRLGRAVGRETAVERMAREDPVGFYLACKDHPESLPD